MWDIIWVGNFPSVEEIEKRKKETSKIDNNSWPVSIYNFIDKDSDDLDIDQEIQDFWEEVIRIIDSIIEKWIDRFKSRTNSNNSYTKETMEIWQEMFNKARWIEDWFDYLNDDEDWDVEIHWDYILEAIENILSPYSSVVYEHLLKNNETIK